MKQVLIKNVTEEWKKIQSILSLNSSDSNEYIYRYNNGYQN